MAVAAAAKELAAMGFPVPETAVQGGLANIVSVDVKRYFGQGGGRHGRDHGRGTQGDGAGKAPGLPYLAKVERRKDDGRFLLRRPAAHGMPGRVFRFIDYSEGGVSTT